MPFLAISSCKYSSCTLRKSPLIGNGKRTLKSARSNFFCSAFSFGMDISAYSGRSFNNSVIKYSLFLSCVINAPSFDNGFFGTNIKTSFVSISHTPLYKQQNGAVFDSPDTILSVEKSCRHIKIILTAVLRILLTDLRLEVVSILSTYGNLLEVFQIVDLCLCIL